VSSIQPITNTGAWINGGYFILKREIFDFMKPGEELVHEPFQRLIEADQLTAYRHEGFWQPMDTFKEQRQLDDLNRSGQAPWRVWETGEDF
jgi:glucose-1-phosphate cytidylyltransferase